MRLFPRYAKIIRTSLTAALILATLTITNATASDSISGLTECDHGCMIEILSGQHEEIATYQLNDVEVRNVRSYISNGPGELGFMR